MEKITQLIHAVPLAKEEAKALEMKAPKLSALYEGIKSGQFQSEAAAVEGIYGNNPNGARYLSALQQRLFNLLSTAVLNLNLDPEDNEATRAGLLCSKDYMSFQILKYKWARKPAMIMAERALKRALKFHFTHIALECAISLRYNMALSGNQKAYTRYDKIVKAQQPIKAAEEEAEAIFAHVMLQFSKSKANKENLQVIGRYTDRLQELLEQHSSYRLRLIAYDVLINAHRLKGEYAQIINKSQEALAFFQSLPFQTAASLFSFNYHAFTCCIRLKQYKAASTYAEACLTSATKGRRNWMIVQYYNTILSFHSGAFHLALASIQSAKQYLPQHLGLRENFLIMDAYLRFFERIGKVAGQQRERFRVARFINEVPEFSKDKRGMNINILIIQILHLLQSQKQGQIIDRMEALEAYRYRHLRRDSTFRSNCFIHLLRQLERGHFHPIAVQRYAAPYLKKLSSMPLEVSLQDLEVEPVPYEVLWELIVGML